MKNINARVYFDVTIPLKDNEDYQDNDLLIEKAIELVNDCLEDDKDIQVRSIEQLDLTAEEKEEAQQKAYDDYLSQCDDYNEDIRLGIRGY